MVAANVMNADTDSEAQYLVTTQQQSFVRLIRRELRLSQPPINDIHHFWSPAEAAHLQKMLACSVYGSAETIYNWLGAFEAKTDADEILMVADINDPPSRSQSVQATANIMQQL